jgi:hypothetical protein
VPHLVRYWPELINTLLEIKTLRYPQGWLEPSGPTDHNNYDVAEIFYRGWPYMDATQRTLAADAVEEMLDWCLKNSVSPKGEILKPDHGDPIPDSYYFAAAFLDTIGFFDPSKKFWTILEALEGDPNRSTRLALSAVSATERTGTVVPRPHCR